MVDEVVQHFSMPSSLSKRYMECSPKIQLQVALVYLSGMAGLFARIENGLNDPLLRTFLVYAAVDSEGATRYFGFNEFEPSLREVMAERVAHEGCEYPSTPRFTRMEHCLNDMAVVGALAWQGALKKRRNGWLTRGALSNLSKLIVDYSIPCGSSDPSVIKIVVDYGLQKALLWETDSEIRLYAGQFRRWLKKSRAECYHDLIHFAFEHTGKWRVEFFREILRKLDGKWLSTSLFPSEDKEQACKALEACRFTGLIDIEGDENEIFFTGIDHTTRLSPDETEQSVVILPDFSAILPREILPDDLFDFCHIGVLISYDQVYKGKINREVLSESLSHGVGQEQIITWLMQWNTPSNVMSTVREWMREFRRLFTCSDEVLISSEENVTKQIESYQPLREHLEAFDAHRVFRIKPGREQLVHDILSKLGFDYRMPLSQVPQPAHPESRGRWYAACNEYRKKWAPVVKESAQTQEVHAPMRGTKYGTELKALDSNEITNVIDYTLLTGQFLTFEYEGSSDVKANTYTVLPIKYQKGMEPTLEAEIQGAGVRKQFFLEKISRIGVVPQ